MAVIALGLSLVSQEAAAFPTRPTDEQLIAALREQRPEAQILYHAFEETSQGGGRVGCGMIEIGGTVEPFAVFTAWDFGSQSVVRMDGAPPPPPEEAQWRIFVTAPTQADRDGDGAVDRSDRNGNVLDRKLALAVCDDLQPPSGVTWAVELERDPD
ncbi:MAG: hypothetical protein ACK4VY_09250 [Brevundimonas sp.]